MRYLVLLIDGMADLPVPELGGRTPLQAAHKPCMDGLARSSVLGVLHVTPDGCKGGSEIGNLAVLGYDPRVYLTGRAPLEAASMGIDMAEDDLAVRCNLVTLSDAPRYEDKVMLDYSSSEISTPEAAELIAAVNEKFGGGSRRFYAGISYKHCLILRHAPDAMSFTPPHNIAGKPIGRYLPQGDMHEELISLMRDSYEFLSAHPVNKARAARGLNPANSLWFWGHGRRMSLPAFKTRHGVSGGVVTAVDLIKGIARCADMKIYEVEGATGNLDTNFEGKADAAVQGFKDGLDLMYLHFEAPDECGHQKDAQGKVRSGELIDSRALSRVLDYLNGTGEPYSVLVTPDHPTLLSTGGHSSLDVPYMIYRSDAPVDSGIDCYCEKTCSETGVYFKDSCRLLDAFIAGRAAE